MSYLDYSQYLNRVASPLQNALSGYKLGSEMRKEQQMQDDLVALSQNRVASASDYASLIAKYPSMSSQLKQSFDLLNSEQQKASQKQALQLFSSLSTGQTEVAKSLINDRLLAAENAGDEQGIAESKAMIELINADPDAARTSAGINLSYSLGPEKFAETLSKVQENQRKEELHPAQLVKSQAEAQQSIVAANFAESKALAELEKNNWDIRKIQNDMSISRQNSAIAAKQAAVGSETNNLKKYELELKLQEMVSKRDQQIRDKASAAEAARLTFDNMLNTIDGLVKNKALDDVVGPIEGMSIYPSILAGNVPFYGEDMDSRANALADIETIKSQQFLTQLQALKAASETGSAGLGSTTVVEIDHLINGIQSLDKRQSKDKFEGSLKEIQQLILKMRKQLTVKYGVPDTVPRTPNAAPSSDELSALQSNYGYGSR